MAANNLKALNTISLVFLNLNNTLKRQVPVVTVTISISQLMRLISSLATHMDERTENYEQGSSPSTDTDKATEDYEQGSNPSTHTDEPTKDSEQGSSAKFLKTNRDKDVEGKPAHKYLVDDEGRMWKYVGMRKANNGRMRRRYVKYRCFKPKKDQDAGEELQTQAARMEDGCALERQ